LFACIGVVGVLAHAAGVVEVQMSEDDVVDLLGAELARSQRGFEAVVLAVDLVDVALLVAPLRANTHVDEHRSIGIFDQQAATGHVDAVVLVRRVRALPERPGDDAEHCAAVESELRFDQWSHAQRKILVAHRLSHVIMVGVLCT
jgi:hypothetical protein